MGSRGGSAPNGLVQRQLRTLFLRAPFDDWAAITQGRKTEFRRKPSAASEILGAKTPTPVVLYSVSAGGTRREKLMVLDGCEIEHLIDIADNPAALAREGFPDYEHFRRYYRARTRKPFRALDKVAAFRVRPWIDGDRDDLGVLLLDRLYGEYRSAA